MRRRCRAKPKPFRLLVVFDRAMHEALNSVTGYVGAVGWPPTAVLRPWSVHANCWHAKGFGFEWPSR